MATDSFSNSKHKWYNFFCSCGIPPSQALKYANNFILHRVSMSMLDMLNKDLLKDMGVDVMGDVIAILREAKKYAMASSNIGLVDPSNTDNVSNNVVTKAVYHSNHYKNHTITNNNNAPIQNRIADMIPNSTNSTNAVSVLKRISSLNITPKATTNRTPLVKKNNFVPRSKSNHNIVSLPSGIQFESKFGSHNPHQNSDEYCNMGDNLNIFNQHSEQTFIKPGSKQFNSKPKLSYNLSKRLDFRTKSISLNAGKPSILDRLSKKRSSVFTRLN